MLGERGGLQKLLTKVFDFGFWTIEKGVLISAVGYASSQVDSVAFSAFYRFLQLFFIAGVYLRMRQVFFEKLDKDQKAATTSQQSLALAQRSAVPLAVGTFLIAGLFDYFTSIMSLKIAH